VFTAVEDEFLIFAKNVKTKLGSAHNDYPFEIAFRK